MKKIIISLLIIAGIILTGWFLKDITIQDSNATDYRFITIQKWNDNKVIYDKETRVQYFVFSEYKAGGGITVLVDAEGKPLLYEGE